MNKFMIDILLQGLDNETRMKLLPKDILNTKVKNPTTGNMIKVQTALSYDDKHPAFKAAQAVVDKNKK